MLRIGICDDELQSRETLCFLLERLIHEKEEQIAYEFSTGKSVLGWLKKHPSELDVLFLDVEMKDLDGMQVAEEIRTFDKTILIVFATGYTDYVFEGYRVNAFDYLVKPIKEDTLGALLTRIRTCLLQRDQNMFIFHNTDGTYRVPYQEILYFYSDKRLVFLVTQRKEYFFYDRLDHLEEALGEQFVRIHQRYLVNGSNVDFIGSSFVSIAEKELPLSRSQKPLSLPRLAKLMLRGAHYVH